MGAMSDLIGSGIMLMKPAKVSKAVLISPLNVLTMVSHVDAGVVVVKAAVVVVVAVGVAAAGVSAGVVVAVVMVAVVSLAGTVTVVAVTSDVVAAVV